MPGKCGPRQRRPGVEVPPLNPRLKGFIHNVTDNCALLNHIKIFYGVIFSLIHSIDPHFGWIVLTHASRTFAFSIFPKIWSASRKYRFLPILLPPFRPSL
jgi:hypothetical protein